MENRNIFLNVENCEKNFRSYKIWNIFLKVESYEIVSLKVKSWTILIVEGGICSLGRSFKLVLDYKFFCAATVRILTDFCGIRCQKNQLV